MKATLTGLTLAVSLTAGGAWAEDEPVGRYTTVVLSSGKIVVTDTQLGRVKICYEMDYSISCSSWST